MSTFKVGNKEIGSPLITPQIKEEIKKENELLKQVTVDTFTPIQITEEQNSQIPEIIKAIDLNDRDLIVNYGTEEGKALNEITSKTLSNVRSSQLGDVGALLVQLASDLTIDDKSETKGFLGFFKKGYNRLKALQIHYETSVDNIKRVVGVLENDQLTLLRNNNEMKEMQAANKENFQRLSVYVKAGQERIEYAYSNELPILEEKAKNGTQEDVNNLTAFRNSLNIFEKQVHDLNSQISLSQAMAIQLETLVNTNISLIQKIQRSVNNLIPAWELGMATAFYGEQTKKALEDDMQFTEMANQTLKNATKNLRETATTAAAYTEQGTIKVETLEAMTDDLIYTLQDIQKSQEAGRENRAKADKTIEELRDKLKSQLISTIQSQ